ncbi:hypothetical protein JJC00_06705 [Bradyrhizobium diazoefficiens]|uniref:competence protein CoiA family protein n=1 Tax=Bradyrhizobium diazoefficiens TaxID=1355477 RepID=UPI00190AC109|nr:competence protein CoiA family protein [Bradyrhizobium diazoefficiens]QQO35363.1 hypothetical protein JJC00_06705 [Bradyrhizobium diazoefficiens]
MSIRLGELFACTEQGGAFVAESAEGRLLHIGEVPSGLACNCVCPGCERRLVAKKGDVQAHHFAHHAQQDGRSCESAGETALHKFAKRILDERLEITLPAQVVEEQKDREVVVRAAKRAFDRAILETKDGQIVPDVVLLLRDRRLIVEFKVTHPCDPEKIARIQAMDIGAIEIDLSQYRNHKLSEIADEILYHAPRMWLHNPREREARARLEERALLRAEEKRTQIEHYRSSYRHRLPSSVPGSGACESAARENGLADLINLPVDGAGCFTVAVAEWQAAILEALLAPTKPPFRTRNALAALRSRRWLDPSFADISDEIASGVRASGTPFNPPFEAVKAYLAHLERLGFVHSDPTEIWRSSHTLKARIDKARELRARPVKRTRQLRQLVEELIADLPADEAAAFVFEQWSCSTLVKRGHSPQDAVGFDETRWRSFTNDLDNIATQIRFSPRERLDLIGLPYQGALARALERQRAEEAERQRANQAKIEADRASRVADLRNRALRQIGGDAEIWLVAINSSTGGRSPIEAASDSEAGHEDAVSALHSRAREIEVQHRASERKAKAVAELAVLAQSRYYDDERATLWMRGRRRELGGKSPEEFTIDDATLQRCGELLPTKRSRR